MRYNSPGASSFCKNRSVAVNNIEVTQILTEAKTGLNGIFGHMIYTGGAGSTLIDTA